MKKLLWAALLLALAPTLLADEQTRQIQSALEEAGFYFGTVDGKMGEETRAAIRRFQIRKGLDVSGEASAETLAALKVHKPENAAAQDERQLASDAKPPEFSPAPKMDDRPGAREPSDLESDEAIGRSPTAEFFTKTDLQDAPATDQNEALLRAQSQLSDLGYYRSLPNGLPGQETESALLRFQRAYRLRLTARLDVDTRRALSEASPSVSAKPFRSSRNRPPGMVYRGVWVR